MLSLLLQGQPDSPPSPDEQGVVELLIAYLPLLLAVAWILASVAVAISAWVRNESALRWGLIVFFGGPLGVLLYLEFTVYK